MVVFVFRHLVFFVLVIVVVVVIHGVPCPIDELEHLAVRAVRVVRNREALDAPRAQPVHPVPEPLRILGVEAGEGDRGELRRVAEDHVAVEVPAVVGRRSVLVGREGREPTGGVEPVGRLDRVGPGGAHDPQDEFAIESPFRDGDRHLRKQAGERGDPARDAGQIDVVRTVQVVEHLGEVVLRERGRRVRSFARRPHKHRVIRHRIEVEGLPKLHVEAARMSDPFSARVAIGIGGGRDRPEREGVEGIRRVDVQIPEVDVAV